MLLANMKEPNIKVLTTKHVLKLEKLNNIVKEALSYRRRLLRRAAARAAAGEKSVQTQTDTEKCHQPVLPLPPISSPPQPDPAPTIVLAAEAEQLPQHHPQHLPLDELCSDPTYAESLNFH